MRMSCNGCRALRKGCTESCTLRPCLQWIFTAQSQANATLFLAKFYGRAGLINLINAGPQNFRPGIFKSLLYEACGRIVSPVHGSLGLMCSGNWHLCEAAVNAVLSGAPIDQVSAELSTSSPPLMPSCDIRHVSKDKKSDDGLHKIKSCGRFKLPGSKRKPKVEEEVYDRVSRGLSLVGEGAVGESLSVETVEASLGKADGSDSELELTLGLEPRPRKGGTVNVSAVNGDDDRGGAQAHTGNGQGSH